MRSVFWFASVLKRVERATMVVASFLDGFGETIGGENLYTNQLGRVSESGLACFR